MKQPRISVITGDGKGKTTQCLGRAIVAARGGTRVLMVQFLKGTGYTGELRSFQNWQGLLEIRQFGAGCPHSAEIGQGLSQCRRCGSCFRENKEPENHFADLAFEYAQAAAGSGRWDMLVLDEISHAINKGLLDISAVIDWIRRTDPKIRLVLSGRNMPQALIEIADEATECMMVKHPIQKGIIGRRGVEY